MRLRSAGSWSLCVLLLAMAAVACRKDLTSPRLGPRTFAAVRVVGDTFPAVHYCTAPGPNREQWVALGGMTMTVNQFDNFELTANDEQGEASFTVSGTGVKSYTGSSAFGGARSVSGPIMPERSGIRVLRMESPASIYGNVEDFSGRISGDSVIVTDRVHCLFPVAGDSVHVFTVILR